MKIPHALAISLGIALIPAACSTKIQPSPEPAPATTLSQPTSTSPPEPTSEPTTTASSPSSQPLTQCPENLPGPHLAFIPHPQFPFCMDTTEVSQSQYAQFLADPQDKGLFQHSRCSKNTNFQPFQGSHLDECDGKESYIYDPKSRGNLPIACIDWCDAAAYCTWAGKRLCGAVGGGGLDHNEAVLTGQWGYVCSQGSQTNYSYGNTFSPNLCADGNTMKNTVEVSGKPECAGAQAPFSEIRNLTGNVAEFEDACENYPFCRVRGLSNDTFAEEATRCDSFTDRNLEAYFPNIGFRCCYD